MFMTRRAVVLSSLVLAAASTLSARASVRNVPVSPVDCLAMPCGPDPVVLLGSKISGISASIDKGSFESASAGLEELFSGSDEKRQESNDAPVYAENWSAAPRLSAGPREQKGAFISNTGVPAPLFLAADCGDKDGCKSETGKIVEDATKAIRDAADRLGNRLRDRNDEKLREGTQRQRDAEKRQKEKPRPNA
jgi:hypothetical protein